MTFAPFVSRSVPRAVIFSPLMPMSPVNAPAGVMMLPPFTTTSYVIVCWCLWQGIGQDIQREIHVSFGDAHRRFDPQHVAVQATLADENAPVSYTHLRAHETR